MKRGRLRVAFGTLVVLGGALGLLAWRSDFLGKVRAVGMAEAFEKTAAAIRRDGFIGAGRAILQRLVDPSYGRHPSLKYSLYDKSSYPAVEDSGARSMLPEYQVVPGIDVRMLPDSRDELQKHETWSRSNGDARSTKYSGLRQINRDNVRFLTPAWSYRSGADLGDTSETGLTVQTNPILADGRLFVSSVDGYLIAVDAETGSEIWRLELPEPVAKRGLIWHADASGARLFVPTGDGVFAVRAEDGKIETGFGDGGRVGTGVSLIAPVIVDNSLVAATLEPAVSAYDLGSGKLLWRKSLLERVEGDLSGGAPWGGMSSDSARSAIFVSTGNPRPALLGRTRPGDNRYTCSVVSINSKTGDVNWSFQEVSHDLWDLDVPAAPILTSITREGRRIDVVAVVTKRGNTLLLDRDFGRPIFSYKLRRTPASKVPGERTSPYQPEFELPEPFSKQNFEESDITDLSEAARKSVERKLRGAQSGFFVPPIMGGKIVLYGLHGGAEWPGAAVDPTSGVLYIPSNHQPWIIRMNYVDTKATAETGSRLPGNHLYQTKCSGCHGSDRAGSYDTEFSGDRYVPPLTGITILRERQTLVSQHEFNKNHDAQPQPPSSTDDELEKLFEYFSALDRVSDREKSFAVQPIWQLLLDDKGYPGVKPPWGYLTALDLNTGKTSWRMPIGTHDELLHKGLQVQGQQNFGGVIATGGGIVFATGTTDNKIRALDAANGRELWSYKLPAAGSTIPTTYMYKGVQYLVVVASGGWYHGYSGRSDQIVAFRLPQQRR